MQLLNAVRKVFRENSRVAHGGHELPVSGQLAHNVKRYANSPKVDSDTDVHGASNANSRFERCRSIRLAGRETG